jgi:hypothetical protein
MVQAKELICSKNEADKMVVFSEIVWYFGPKIFRTVFEIQKLALLR